jgi:WD40 repeat protein
VRSIVLAAGSLAALAFLPVPTPGQLDLPPFKFEPPPHSRWVCCLAFSPDGKRLVSAGVGGTRGPHSDWFYEMKVWEAETHKEVLSWPIQDFDTRRVAYSPDGKHIVSTGSTLRVWDASTGRQEAWLDMLGFGGDVIFSPDSKRIIGARRGGEATAEVLIWDVETGEQLSTVTLRGRTKDVDEIALSRDGKLAVTLSRDGALKLWNAETGQEKLIPKGRNKQITTVAISPDGKRIASRQDSGDVIVWDVERGEENLKLQDREGRVVFSPNGKRIVSIRAGVYSPLEDVLKVWDAETGKQLLTSGFCGRPNCLAFSPDGKRLVVGGGWTPIEFRPQGEWLWLTVP